jgi:FAD/FMN-containing dehydrogenase
LFVSTQGTTGVVTKVALQLQPRPPHRARWFAFAYELTAAYRAMDALARTGSFDDVGLMTWPAAKMLFGATRGLVRAEDEPLAFLFIDITGATEAELTARLDLARDQLSGAGVESIFPVDDLVEVVPQYAKLAELPTTLDFLLDFPGGGLSWVGSYGPSAQWLEGAEKGLGLLEEHGFPPFLVARPMQGGHYFVLRFVACFDKGDPAEVERVRTVMGLLADLVLDHDYVPYKASADAARRIRARAQPGFGELFGRVGAALDPDGRMNPGRWYPPRRAAARSSSGCRVSPTSSPSCHWPSACPRASSRSTSGSGSSATTRRPSATAATRYASSSSCSLSPSGAEARWSPPAASGRTTCWPPRCGAVTSTSTSRR